VSCARRSTSWASPTPTCRISSRRPSCHHLPRPRPEAGEVHARRQGALSLHRLRSRTAAARSGPSLWALICRPMSPRFSAPWSQWSARSGPASPVGAARAALPHAQRIDRGHDHQLRRRNQAQRAETALRENERLLKDIIDGSPSPIFLKDLQGRFLTINKRLEGMLGMSHDRLKG